VNPEGQSTCKRCGAPLPKVRVAARVPAGAQPESGAPVNGQGTLFRPGQVVAGRYSVIDIIGRGGMGCIYRVRDTVLGEEVALKTLLPQFVQNRVIVERFFNEARIARHLSHPNIIRIHDIGRAANVVYISMELLKGRSLRTVLDEMAPGEYMPVEQALHIIDNLCAALEYAHQHTVHRDIKPENVMILPDGSVKLMDFGISKLITNARLTSASMVMGTPMYMSPEQLKDSRDVDARADVFSVGVVLYETLTGNLPTGVPKAVSEIRRDVPIELDAIIGTCVEPNRDLRYGTITELRDALLGVRVGIKSTFQTVTAGTRIAPTVGRGLSRRRMAGFAVAALIVAASALGLWRIEAVQQANGPTSGVQRAGRAASLAETGSVESDFDRVASLIETARPRAQVAAQGVAERQALLRTAEALWEQARAEQERQAPAALHTAVAALQCFCGLVHCPDGMVFVPPGEVIMGDATGTGSVRVGGFFIDRTEVTVEQYRLFCANAAWRQPPGLTSALPEWPVTSVTFYDAQAYAAHQRKRLPTEAQWARAAYGGQGASDRFPWGENWEVGASNVEGGEDGFQGPAPVGSFAKDCSPFGCVDMAGNAMEWTRSAFRALPYDPSDGREDPSALDFGVEIVLRGGHFGIAAAPLNCRHPSAYEAQFECLGFRCVRELPPSLDALAALLGPEKGAPFDTSSPNSLDYPR